MQSDTSHVSLPFSCSFIEWTCLLNFSSRCSRLLFKKCKTIRKSFILSMNAERLFQCLSKMTGMTEKTERSKPKHFKCDVYDGQTNKICKKFDSIKTLSCKIIFKYCGHRIKHNILFVTVVNYCITFFSAQKSRWNEIKTHYWSKCNVWMHVFFFSVVAVVCIILFVKHDCSVLPQNNWTDLSQTNWALMNLRFQINVSDLIL